MLETRYHHLLSTSADSARTKLDEFNRLGSRALVTNRSLRIDALQGNRAMRPARFELATSASAGQRSIP